MLHSDKLLTFAEIFDLGYAVPMYDMSGQWRYWRYRGEDYTLPANSVHLHEVPGIGFPVGRIEDVRA